MYFYILPGPFRLGFGITGNYERREKDYTGAWGGIAEFKYLFKGPTPHVKRLENIIKISLLRFLYLNVERHTAPAVNPKRQEYQYNHFVVLLKALQLISMIFSA